MTEKQRVLAQAHQAQLIALTLLIKNIRRIQPLVKSMKWAKERKKVKA